MLLQLDPPLHLLTPLGPGWAHLWRSTGPGGDDWWTVFLATGAIVSFRNEQVRAANDYSAGRWNPGLGKALMESTRSPADVDMRDFTQPATKVVLEIDKQPEFCPCGAPRGPHEFLRACSLRGHGAED